MIDAFHVMYMYRKIQAEAATTDIKTLEQLLKKFRKVVAERRKEYYREIGEKKAQNLRAERLQKLLEKMGRDRVSPVDLIDWLLPVIILYLHQATEVSMGWELHIIRTENWFDRASNPISSEEWLQLVDDDKELSIDHKNGEFFAIWSGQSEHDEPWLDWNHGRISTKHPDEALYCKMLQIADKLNAVVVDEDDHKYLLLSDLMNPSWVNSSSTGKKNLYWAG